MKYLIKNLFAFAGLVLAFNISFAQTAAIEQPVKKQEVNISSVETNAPQQIQQSENKSAHHFYVAEINNSDQTSIEKNPMTALESKTERASVVTNTSNTNPK